MLYKQFKDLSLSGLGFGTMRLPLLEGGGPGDIDQAQVEQMTDYALAHGVNYFDTALPYHAGRSEASIGRALARYPRESFYLADKFPGHQVVKGAPISLEETFPRQLQNCGVDYFDFYLLHNVNEHSFAYYTDKSVGCVDYFLEQKKLGRIRHLGFSSHNAPENLERFLDIYGDVMEFCQIQLNYLDWSLQDAEKKCALLKSRGIPIWVMEPLRGGRLARLDEPAAETLRALRPDESPAAWGLRWLQTVPEVTVVLSGMSSLSQMEDNIRTFSDERPLSEKETAALYGVAAGLRSFIPCTGCRYCCAGCPQGLDIPLLMSLCNDSRVSGSINIVMRYGALGEKNAEACIACGKCKGACPQKIDVPAAMKELAAHVSAQKSWEETCRERAAASAREQAKK